jgi:signal transduction histidine kinase
MKLDTDLNTRWGALAPDAGGLDATVSQLVQELRRPILEIRSALAALDCAAHMPGAVDRIQRTMARHLGQLTVLVEDIPDMALYAQGNLALRLGWIDVSTTATAAFESCRWALGSTGHRLALQAPDGPIQLFADPARVRQIIINLLGYAARCTSPFGAIGLALRVASDHVMLHVVMRDSPADYEDEVGMDSCAPAGDLWASELPREIPLGLAFAARLAALHGGTLSTRIPEKGGVGSLVVRLPLRSRRPGSFVGLQSCMVRPFMSGTL